MVDSERELELWTLAEKEKIKIGSDVEKHAMLAEIDLKRATDKVERLSDIRAREQLQKTVLSCTADGSVILQREGFGETISGKLPLKIKAAKCYCHIGDVEPVVLVLVVEKESGETVSLFWMLEQVEDRYVRKVFERHGILFGFGERKEQSIRRQILQMARNMAKTCEIPEEHGWYQLGNEWRYAFPEELTWKEVRGLC